MPDDITPGIDGALACRPRTNAPLAAYEASCAGPANAWRDPDRILSPLAYREQLDAQASLDVFKPNTLREGDWFDERAAAAACAFFPRYLRLTKDKWAGRPFHLTEFQSRDVIRPLFGWKRADGTRRFRRVAKFVPRKNGKTEEAAGIAILATKGDGYKGAETYLLASKESQARICFDKAVKMVAANNALALDCAITVESIYWAAEDSFIKPLDGRARGKHGLNASALIADEVHEWRNGDLYTTVHQSEAAREQPIEYVISTAGVRGWGYGWEVWQECEQILSGESDDDETLVVIYAADAEDDWTSEATWAKANPGLGDIVKLDYLRGECRKAVRNKRLENDFRRYHLNQWVGQSERWLSLVKWDACKASDWRDESALIGKPCYGGVDLSSTNDLTAIAWAFPPDDWVGIESLLSKARRWRRVYRVFMPEGRIKDRVAESGLPYDRWVEAGAIIATPGNSVDYEFVIDQLLKDCLSFDVRLVGFDRFNMLHVTNRAQAKGLPPDKFVQVGQGFTSMSGASKYYEKLIDDAALDHGGHPVARFCADNVMIMRDPADNIKPAKNKSVEKIDVVVADIMAQFVAINGYAPPSGLGSV